MPNRSSQLTAREFAENAAERVIEQLMKDVAPWQKERDAPTGAEAPPYNPVSGTRYRGLNSIMLRSEAEERGYSDLRWVTFNNAKKLGGRIRKGERGTAIEYWKFFLKTEGKVKDAKDGEEQENPKIIHLTYTVFNGEQVKRIPPREIRTKLTMA